MRDALQRIGIGMMYGGSFGEMAWEEFQGWVFPVLGIRKLEPPRLVREPHKGGPEVW